MRPLKLLSLLPDTPHRLTEEIKRSLFACVYQLLLKINSLHNFLLTEYILVPSVKTPGSSLPLARPVASASVPIKKAAHVCEPLFCFLISRISRS